MTWHYRPCKRKNPDGSLYYVVVEFFGSVCGKSGWTDGEMAPYGESRKELIKDLEMMLKDCKHYNTLDDTREKI